MRREEACSTSSRSSCEHGEPRAVRPQECGRCGDDGRGGLGVRQVERAAKDVTGPVVSARAGVRENGPREAGAMRRRRPRDGRIPQIRGQRRIQQHKRR